MPFCLLFHSFQHAVSWLSFFGGYGETFGGGGAYLIATGKGGRAGSARGCNFQEYDPSGLIPTARLHLRKSLEPPNVTYWRLSLQYVNL